MKRRHLHLNSNEKYENNWNLSGNIETCQLLNSDPLWPLKNLKNQNPLQIGIFDPLEESTLSFSQNFTGNWQKYQDMALIQDQSHSYDLYGGYS